MLEKEIDIINRIIKEAVRHGADSGGSYDSNEEELTISVNLWLELKGITSEYIVAENSENGYIQIMKKDTIKPKENFEEIWKAF